MSDIHSNIINSLAKVIDSAQSGYAPKGLPNRIPNEIQSHNLTLTVLSVKDNQILLEEQVSGKKLLIDIYSLQNSSSKNLARGDNLVLVSSNTKFATFVIEKNSQQNPNKLQGQNLQNLTHALSMQWPDVPSNIIKKTQPLILNQIHLATNTQQAKNLANSIIAIATKSGQPILAVNTNATVSFIGNNQNVLGTNNSAAIAIRFNVDINSKQTIPLTIPLNANLSPVVVQELKEKFSTNQQLSLTLDAISKNKILTNIRTKGQSPLKLSAVAMREINSALNVQSTQIKQHLSPLVLSPHSPNLQSGIAIIPSEQNLQTLGAVIKQQITHGVSKEALLNTRILLSQSQQSNSRVQVSLVDKPLTISIPNHHLADAKINDITLASGQSKKVNADESTFVRSQSAITNGVSTAKNNGIQQQSIEAVKTTTGPINSKTLQSELINVLKQKGNSESAITNKIAGLQGVIYNEMNQLLPRAESMSKALPSLLTHLQAIEKGAGHELKQLIARVNTQIKNHLPATETISGTIPSEFADSLDEIALSPDSTQIKEALTTAALPNINGVPVQAITSVNSQSGLVNGLVTMLQASLQAKLIAQQPQLLSALLQSPQFTQLIPKMMGFTKNTNAQSKVLQDLNKLDPRNNLIGELNKVLSSHSLHKLSSSESALQNQDSFYYTLPNMFSPQHKDIEIVIKREQEAAQEKDQKVQQSWQLSMKLDIGDMGEVLAKVKLLNENVDLNLYASNQALKEKILEMLPYLNGRLEALGLAVKPQCYLGKIPNSLHKTEYQVVQAYV